MTNDWIYEKANALVRKHFTRDPFELAKDLNIHLEVMNNMKKQIDHISKEIWQIHSLLLGRTAETGDNK